MEKTVPLTAVMLMLILVEELLLMPFALLQKNPGNSAYRSQKNLVLGVWMMSLGREASLMLQLVMQMEWNAIPAKDGNTITSHCSHAPAVRFSCDGFNSFP